MASSPATQPDPDGRTQMPEERSKDRRQNEKGGGNPIGSNLLFISTSLQSSHVEPDSSGVSTYQPWQTLIAR